MIKTAATMGQKIVKRTIMKNDECRMSNDEGMTKLESRTMTTTTRPVFGVRHSDLIRHSSFVHSSFGESIEALRNRLGRQLPSQKGTRRLEDCRLGLVAVTRRRPRSLDCFRPPHPHR